MDTVYQLRIDLIGAKPPIWRRILISPEDNLYDLHCAVQSAMGWLNGHLHGFEKRGNHYGMILEEDGFMDFMETKDETKFHIRELLSFEKDTLDYTYDFGDSWDHRIKLEKIINTDVESQLPRCIKGKNACPPEDIGGLWGYYDMLEALQDPNHPEHYHYLEWIGGEFDASYFDLDEINEAMAEGCIEYMFA